MSKIGKKPITIPSGVTITLNGQHVAVKGPKGNLELTLTSHVTLKLNETQLDIDCPDETKKNFRGLSRTLVSNMVEGVTNGYEKKLMILGVGFGAKIQGKEFVLSLGFSHPVIFPIPNGIEAIVEKDPKGNDIITLKSIDKQLLGEFATNLRGLKKPEPYKGKGIRFIDEVIKLKAGKSAKK